MKRSEYKFNSYIQCYIKLRKSILMFYVVFCFFFYAILYLSCYCFLLICRRGSEGVQVVQVHPLVLDMLKKKRNCLLLKNERFKNKVMKNNFRLQSEIFTNIWRKGDKLYWISMFLFKNMYVYPRLTKKRV